MTTYDQIRLAALEIYYAEGEITQRELADRVLATRRRGSASARVEAWFATRGPALAVWQRRLADVRALERQDFATLSVVLAAARELAA